MGPEEPGDSHPVINEWGQGWFPARWGWSLSVVYHLKLEFRERSHVITWLHWPLSQGEELDRLPYTYVNFQMPHPWRRKFIFFLTYCMQNGALNRNKNSMVLAQKQIWRPVEQNRGPGYESTQLCLPYFWQRHQKHTTEKRQPLQ
jgi:hypothetical protein